MRNRIPIYKENTGKVILLGMSLCMLSVDDGYAAASDNIPESAVSVTTFTEGLQQSRTVKGTVVDELGDPVAGATIRVQGTTNGTATDGDGTFLLDNVQEGATLEITYIGYVPQTVKVSGSGSIDIKLVEDSQQLDEVVVTGFGLAQKKATMTGAISAIGDKDLSRSLGTTTSAALSGKIAGVNFRQTDNRPGRGARMQIRNMGTPLYVIDGVIKDEDQFNYIDFNDIESISILKDASAAIYGVRAANGVVVVTTKRGARNSRNTVGLTFEYGWGRNSMYPKPADANTYIRNYIQSETVQHTSNYTYTKEDYAKWQQGTEKGYRPFDWYDFIWGTAPQDMIKADITGGGEKSNYYVSVSHMDEKTTIKKYDGFQKTNVQLNLDTQITDKFKIGFNMNGHIREFHNPGVPEVNDYYMPSFATYRNLPTIRPYANDNPLYPTKTSSNGATNFAILNYELSGERKDQWRVMQIGADAEYQLFDGLKAKAMVSYYYENYYMNNQEFTYKEYTYDPETDTYPVMYEMTNPWREREQDHKEETTANIQLNYAKTFNKVHNVAAVVGFESSLRKNPKVWVHSRPTANTLNLLDYQTMDTYNDTGENPEARMGWLGRFNYDYANKYLIELSGRYDGSWKFPPDHRWGFFPSASVGWRISEESFWKDTKLANIFTDLKLRASYGVVGDDNTSGYSAYDYMSGYTYKNGGSVIDGAYTIGTVARGLPVTTLSWMKAKTLDIGFDASFLRGRLSIQADYFNRLRTGIPAGRYDVLIPSEAGFSLPKENLASDLNRGFDAGATWRDRIGEVDYNIGLNVTYARKYNWDSYKPRFSNSYDEYRNSSEHRFSDTYWGYQVIGQFQNWEEIYTYNIDNDQQGNTTLRPGDLKYKDVNGDGIINNMDQRPIGYYTLYDGTSTSSLPPNLSGGFNMGASWKGIELNADFTFAAGYSWYQNYEMRNPFHDGGNNAQFYMEDTWHLADIWDASSEYQPGKYPMLLVGNSSHSNYWASDFWLWNSRYVRLKNLQIGYNFPKDMIRKIYLSGLLLYASCSNVFTLTNIPGGMDPEIAREGGYDPPARRIINLGIKVKF